jgi:hypothetical protein
MTNIICLRNLIRLYRVNYDSKRQMAFIVHWEEFGLPNMIFDMHPFGLHIYYPEKTDRQYGFVQIIADNMKLFTNQQIKGALKARRLYKTLGYPSNANFEAVLRVVALAVVPLQLTMPRLPTRFGTFPSLDLKAVL